MVQNRSAGSLLIYPIFFFSGMSALIYEVVWMKELTLIMGNTIHSSTTVLAAFMAGLALGSIYFGHLVDRTLISPLKYYAYLELGIGLFAFIFPFLINGFQTVYISIHNYMGLSRSVFIILGFIVSFILLLVPTILMGATLPVLSKYVEEGYENIGKKIGLLYGVNTLGAVLGILVTGYLLIGLIGIKVPTFLAIMINLMVSIFALLLEMKERKKVLNKESPGIANHHDVTAETSSDDFHGSLKRIATATYCIWCFCHWDKRKAADQQGNPSSKDFE